MTAIPVEQVMVHENILLVIEITVAGELSSQNVNKQTDLQTDHNPQHRSHHDRFGGHHSFSSPMYFGQGSRGPLFSTPLHPQPGGPSMNVLVQD
jgi:hypothetical protein